MKDNLENIGFSDVVSTNGKKYTELRKELTPVYRKALFDILKGYFFLLAIIVINCLFIKSGSYPAFIAIPVCALMIGYCLAYLHLFIHAAAHYDIHRNKKKNDQLSDLLIGVFFGIPVKKYRKIHWLHHEHLGTTSDSEHSYFNELNLVFLLKSITGIHTLSVIAGRLKTQGQLTKQKTSLAFSLYTLTFHLCLLTALFAGGSWYMVMSWLAGLVIVFPAFAIVRQLLEHRDVQAKKKIDYNVVDHGKTSRLFGESIVDSSFGAAGFNRHLLHHWDPSISYTRLRELEQFLEKCPKTAIILQESKTSYFKTFIALFKR